MSEQATGTRASPSADEIIEILRAREVELRKAGIRRLALFGAAARGEMGLEDDVDIAVVLDPAAHIGLIGLSALERRIGELIGHHVDLVPEPVDTRHLREYIDRSRKLAF